MERARLARLYPVAVSLAYLAGWLGLAQLGRTLGVVLPFSPWFPGAALSLFLFWRFGVRYWPAVLAGFVADQWLRHGSDPYGLGVSAVFGGINALGYALLARFVRSRMRMPLEGVREVLLFTGPVATLGTLLIAIAATGFDALAWHTAPLLWLRDLLRFWIGDGVGIATLFPVLALFEHRNELRARLDVLRRSAPGLAAIVGCIVLGYLFPVRGVGDALSFFALLFLAWIASTRLLDGAVFAGLTLMVTVAIANHLFLPSAAEVVRSEALVVVGALTSLMVGALAQERFVTQRRLEELAYYDLLTGLPNRLLLEQRLAQIRDDAFTLVILDLDDMEVVNDGLGRNAGDHLIASVASRIQDADLGEALLAHVTSDEFALLFPGDVDVDEVLRRVDALFERPFPINGSEVYVSASLGYVRREAAHVDAGEMLRRADVALRSAKARGRGAAAGYDDQSEAALPTVSLATQLHRALERDEFTLFFQPIVKRLDVVDAVVGAEALLRWRHPQRGLVDPEQFLSVLERLALAQRVGTWVVGHALEQAARWHRNGLKLRVWINVFGRQLVTPEFMDLLQSRADALGIPRDHVVVEVSERTVTEDEEHVIRAVRALRLRGFETAIDDFGTGSSTLGRLHEVPFHYVKIDRSFVTRCEVDPSARSVVRAVLDLTRDLSMEPLAEGVENERQLNILSGRGCTLFQGYYLGHPMPADAFVQLASQTAHR